MPIMTAFKAREVVSGERQSNYTDNGTAEDARRIAQFWATEIVALDADLERVLARKDETDIARGRDREARLRAAETQIDADLAAEYELVLEQFSQLLEELVMDKQAAEQALSTWLDAAREREAAAAP